MANYRKRIYRMTTKAEPGFSNFEQLITSDSGLGTIFSAPVVQRSSVQQFTANSNIPFINVVVSNLVAALNSDYGITGEVVSNPVIFSTEVNGDEFSITANEYGVEFLAFSTSWCEVIEDIPEEEPGLQKEIINITASEAGFIPEVFCQYDFELLFWEASDFPLTINTPITKVCNSVSDLFFEYNRYIQPQATLSLTTDQGEVISTPLPRVSYDLKIDDIDINYSGSSASMIVYTSYISQEIDINVEYSLGGDWQDSNYFYGILPGDYTVSVRDGLGVVVTQDIEVVAIIDKPPAYFELPKANSIKFKKDTIFTPCGEKPNFDNAFIIDQEYFNIEKQNYIQLVQTCDVTAIQLRSTYDNNTCIVYDTDENIVQSPPVEKKVTNINLLDKRDAMVKPIDNGTRALVYYLSGNIYEPNTTTVINDYLIPNGATPAFATDAAIESGMTLSITSDNQFSPIIGTYTVLSRYYDSEIEGWGLVIGASVGASESIRAQAKYNQEVYDVYEAEINWLTIEEGNYRVRFSGTDINPNYDDVSQTSECVSNKEEQDKHTVIDYTSTESTQDVDYSTGIEFRLRVPARFVDYRNGGESENMVTDNGARKQLKGTVTDEVQLETSLIPQYLRKKIEIASIHKILRLNDQDAVLVEKGEGENLFSELNPFYKFNAWYQVGSPIVIGGDSGIVSGSQGVLEVNSEYLEIDI